MLKPMVMALAFLSAPAAFLPHLALADTASPLAATPDAAARIAALTDTMRMADVFAVMVDEGTKYGTALEDEMFPGQGGARWSTQVAAAYDVAAMRQRFEGAMQVALADDSATVEAALAFFGSELGQEILKLEVGARRAMMDVAVEEAAQVAVQKLEADRSPRLKALRRLIVASDLIEMNVAGALSANLAFYEGMASVDGFADKGAREQMLADVWDQEAQVRAENAAWIIPFMAMAYQSLSDDELKSYIDFSESPEGKRLNVALFSGFDAVFLPISRQLGKGAAQILQGHDI